MALPACELGYSSGTAKRYRQVVHSSLSRICVFLYVEVFDIVVRLFKHET